MRGVPKGYAARPACGPHTAHWEGGHGWLSSQLHPAPCRLSHPALPTVDPRVPHTARFTGWLPLLHARSCGATLQRPPVQGGPREGARSKSSGHLCATHGCFPMDRLGSCPQPGPGQRLAGRQPQGSSERRRGQHGGERVPALRSWRGGEGVESWALEEGQPGKLGEHVSLAPRREGWPGQLWPGRRGGGQRN